MNGKSARIGGEISSGADEECDFEDARSFERSYALPVKLFVSSSVLAVHGVLMLLGKNPPDLTACSASGGPL
jgi:hypothetical protein